MSVVTIARLTGSGGDSIASRVADILGYGLVDSSLLASIAARAGVSMEDVMPFDEKSDSVTMEWLKSFITPRIDKIIHQTENQLGSEGYMQSLKTVVNGLAEKGNIVIVGRGSQYILQNHDNTMHIRIIAEPETRVDWLCRYYAISREEALDRIKRSDSMRRSFIQRYYKKDWDDIFAYNMVINTTKMSMDEAVETIVSAIRAFNQRHDYIPGVRDRRRGERRQRERRKGERRNTVIWTNRDMEAAFFKEGRPLRTLSKPDRRIGERRGGWRRKTDAPSEKPDI